MFFKAGQKSILVKARKVTLQYTNNKGILYAGKFIHFQNIAYINLQGLLFIRIQDYNNSTNFKEDKNWLDIYSALCNASQKYVKKHPFQVVLLNGGYEHLNIKFTKNKYLPKPCANSITVVYPHK